MTYGYLLPMLLASSSSRFVMFNLRPFASDQSAHSVSVCGVRRRPCLIRGPQGLAVWLDLGCVAQTTGWSAAPRPLVFYSIRVGRNSIDDWLLASDASGFLKF